MHIIDRPEHTLLIEHELVQAVVARHSTFAEAASNGSTGVVFVDDYYDYDDDDDDDDDYDDDDNNNDDDGDCSRTWNDKMIIVLWNRPYLCVYIVKSVVYV